MVLIDELLSPLTILIAISATLAAIMGLVVLEHFFRNKLKQLFDDVTYFIFFFLIMGYLLYSIGEISFYLTAIVFGDTSSMGIADVYWSLGAVCMLFSFITLTIFLIRKYYNKTKVLTLGVFGSALMVLVLLLLFGVTLGSGGHFFGYFYPIISSLIVTFALSVVLFSSNLEQFGKALFFFFLASCAILLADVLFTFITAEGIYGLAGFIADIFYLVGYSLSFFAFIILRKKMRALAF